MSREFRIFRHFVTIFRILMIFKMSYLFNQVRVSKKFFTFKFLSEYSFKIANLLWHKLKLIFCCQSYDVIFAPKTVKIKNPKTYDCWEYKVLLPCKVSAQTVKNWKSRLKMFTFWWQLTRRVVSQMSFRGETQSCPILSHCYGYWTTLGKPLVASRNVVCFLRQPSRRQRSERVTLELNGMLLNINVIANFQTMFVP